MQDMMGKIWHPTQMIIVWRVLVGIVCVLSVYDDRMEGGAFQIMNNRPALGEQGNCMGAL